MAAPLPRLRSDVSMLGLLATVLTAIDKLSDKHRQASARSWRPVRFLESDEWMAANILNKKAPLNKVPASE